MPKKTTKKTAKKTTKKTTAARKNKLNNLNQMKKKQPH